MPQEFRDKCAKINPKPDKNYCVDFQEPPIGNCALQGNGEWSHRRKLTDGTWTCLRPGCKFDHLDAPLSQHAAMMEIKNYREEVNRYFAGVKEQEGLAEAQAAAAAADQA